MYLGFLFCVFVSAVVVVVFFFFIDKYQTKMIYNIGSKFVSSNSIARACFIFLLCTLMTSANKCLEKKNFSAIDFYILHSKTGTNVYKKFNYR